MKSPKFAVEFINIDGTTKTKYYQTMKKAIKEYSKYINNMQYYFIIRIVDLNKNDI